MQRPGSALSRFASPVQASTEKQGSDLERLLVDLDMSRSAPSREVTIPYSKGKKIRLNDEEYEILSEADQKATALLRRTVKNGEFRRMDQDDQKEYVEKVFARARSQAKDRLWSRRELRRRASAEVR